MKHLIYLIAILAVCFSSCTQQNQKAKEKEMKAQEKEVAAPQAPASPWQLLINSVEQHLTSEQLFGITILDNDLKEVLGDKIHDLKKDWNVISPVNRSNNIFSISGCRQNNCPESLWVIYADIADNIVNVYHFEKNNLTIYKGKELIQLTPSMQETLNTMKQNARVTEKTTKII